MLQKKRLLNKISRILIISRSGSGKSTLSNIINHQTDIGLIYLYAKDPYEAKCKLLINIPEQIGSNYFKDS